MGTTPYSAAISLWKSITSKFGDTLQLDCSNISMLTAQEIIKGTTAKRFRAVIEQLKIGIDGYVHLSVYNDYSNKPLYSQAQQIGVVFNEEEYAKNTIRFVQHRFGNNVVYDTSKASWFRQFI